MTERCDPNIYENGKVIAVLAEVCPDVMEAWCQKISKDTGQKVDWHFMAGRAVVKALGDLGKVDKRAYWDFGEDGVLQGMGGAISVMGYFPGGENHWSKDV